MARTRKPNLERLKQNAPNVPGDTCPTFNYVQEMLNQLVERHEGDAWMEVQKEVINQALEYLRSANEELRASSKYWYEQCKKIA